MRYEEKYKEALERAKKLYEQGTITESLNYIFPELKESDDESIRKRIIALVNAHGQGMYKDEMLAWLEKQGEPMEINPTEFDTRLQALIEKFNSLPKEEFIGSLNFWLNVIQNDGTYREEKQVEQKSADKIQLGKKYKCIASPRYSTFMLGEVYKAKDEFLCSLMNFCSDCFEPIEDDEQKIADKYDIREIKSKHAEGKLGEMIKEMESANKVEPKFKVGDWIYHEISGNVFHINRIENRTYISDEGATISFGRQNDWRLWTIKDAKDGDVLAREPIYDYPSPFIAICKERGLDYFNSYCFIGFDAKFYTGDTIHDIIGIHPATKEQRDTLMKVMSDAGYEWDTEKKELKKIEQKPAWSEEDKEVLNLIIARLNSHPNVDLEEYSKEYNWLNYNLKSLKERYSWKPTEEQLKQLRKYCPDNTALTALYEYLKQL